MTMVVVVISKPDGTALETLRVVEEFPPKFGNYHGPFVRAAREIADLIERNFECQEEV